MLSETEVSLCYLKPDIIRKPKKSADKNMSVFELHGNCVICTGVSTTFVPYQATNQNVNVIIRQGRGVMIPALLDILPRMLPN